MSSTLLDFIALSLLPLGAWRDVADGLRAGELPGALLARMAWAHPGPGLSVIHLRERAGAAIERGRRTRLQPITWADEAYPSALAAIADPPPVLWIRGKARALNGPAVAIVGSRAGTPYALEVARQLGADLAARSIVVTSGLARGVDSAAHRGALDVSGATVALLGCGADVSYPREHRELADRICVDGAIVSELIPGTPPHKFFFPRRNRLISGLSRAVVVIEAGEKSGSLITARCALEQGRDVLAVPGNVLSGRNRGGHALLRDGAKIVETADDILEELGLPSAHRAGGSAATCCGVTPGGDPLLAHLPGGEACDLDTLAERSGWPPARLLPRLFELELQGIVRRVGGGRFMRVDRSC